MLRFVCARAPPTVSTLTDSQEFKKIIGLTAIFLGGAFGSAVLAAKAPFLPNASPQYFLTVLSVFGFVEVCLCKIYPKKGGK